MTTRRILHLCNDVETLAYTLENLNERTSCDSAQATLVRMRLAALTTELIAADAIERARQSAALASHAVP